MTVGKAARPILIREAHTHCAATRVDDNDRRRLCTLRDTPGTALTSAREGGGIPRLGAVRRLPACAGHTPHVTLGRLQRKPCIQRGALCWRGQQPRQRGIGRLFPWFRLLSSGGARFTAPATLRREDRPRTSFCSITAPSPPAPAWPQRCLLRPCAGLRAPRCEPLVTIVHMPHF